MVWFLVSLAVLLVGSALLNVKLVQQNLVLSDQREDLVDQIEESLDMLDVSYQRLAHHANVPVLSDEPIIQDVVRDIKIARNTVLAVASKVAAYGNVAPGTDEQE
jgi:hypothetical protein